MAGFGSVGQEDWGGGIFRGRNAPADSVYDAVNALVNDERELVKRGGTTFFSAALAGTLVGIADVLLPTVGQMTLAWSATSLFRVDTGATLGVAAVRPAARGVGVGDWWIAPSGNTTGAVTRWDGAGTASVVTLPGPATVDALAVVGTVPRLIVASGNRAYFSPPGVPFPAPLMDYHELPMRAQIIGADGIGDSAVLFTTVGVWTISNMDFDPVDDQGNVQHQVRQIAKDVILWGDAGVVGWAGGLLVPTIDDVVVLGLDGTAVPVSGAIRPLYRGYVKAGHKPGLATVHRGHYFLPILDSSYAVIDVLVCRLDLRDRNGMKPAWTRWAGHAAGPGFAVRVGASTRQPRLLGLSGTRVTELTDTFNVPGTATDADGTTPAFTVDTQDYAVGNRMRDSYVDRIRVEYEAAGTSPAVSVGWASGAEGAAFTTLTATRGGGASDGSDYSVWPVRKKRDRIRFRISSVSAVTKLILRRLEILVRADGRQ